MVESAPFVTDPSVGLDFVVEKSNDWLPTAERLMRLARVRVRAAVGRIAPVSGEKKAASDVRQ